MQHSIVVYRLLIGLCFFFDSSSPPLASRYFLLFVVVVAQEKKYGGKRLFLMMRQDFFFLERERRRFYRTGQVEAFRPSIFSSSSFSSYREVKKEDFPSRPVITSTIYGVFLFTLSNTRTQDVDRHKET